MEKRKKKRLSVDEWIKAFMLDKRLTWEEFQASVLEEAEKEWLLRQRATMTYDELVAAHLTQNELDELMNWLVRYTFAFLAGELSASALPLKVFPAFDEWKYLLLRFNARVWIKAEQTGEARASIIVELTEQDIVTIRKALEKIKRQVAELLKIIQSKQHKGRPEP